MLAKPRLSASSCVGVIFTTVPSKSLSLSTGRSSRIVRYRAYSRLYNILCSGVSRTATRPGGKRTGVPCTGSTSIVVSLDNRPTAGNASRAPRSCCSRGATPTIPVMDKNTVLLDAATGLYVRWYFWIRVLDEVNRSARYGSPFALLLLEAIGQPGTPVGLPHEALGSVPRAVRSTDLAGAVGSARAGVLLPEQDVEAAAQARAGILARLDPHCPRGLRWEARLLCYPQDGAEISNLVTTGWSERRDEHASQPAEQPA